MPPSGVIPLSTGSAVRPHVTVNLTEQDIQDSDELYEVKALLKAITRDPHRGLKNLKNRKKPAQDQPAAGRATPPQGRLAPQQPGRSRPAAAQDRPQAGSPTRQERPEAQAQHQARPAAQTPPAAPVPSKPEAGPARAPRPEPGRSVADVRPPEPAPPAKPPAGRRKTPRPVTLILVDEEGRPQAD